MIRFNIFGYILMRKQMKGKPFNKNNSNLDNAL